MLMPDCSQHNPSPEYMRQLALDTGMTQQQIADRLGLGLRTVNRYIADGSAPYSFQYALEVMAKKHANSC